MKIAVLFAALLAICLPAFADSQPTLASARRDFQAADLALNKTYKAVCATLTKPRVTELRELEKDWIEYRGQKAEDLLHFNGDVGDDEYKPEAIPSYWKYMTTLTQTRVDFLKVYSGANIPKGITGTYDDFYDGTLTLKVTNAGIEFSCEAVRGRAENEGEIDGVAQLQGDKATYKEVVPAGEDRKPAQLTFTFTDGHVVKVESQDANYNQGNGAYFDGTYYKTGQ